MIGANELGLFLFLIAFLLMLYHIGKEANTWNAKKKDEESAREYHQEQYKKYSECPTKHANAGTRVQRYDPPGGGGRLEVERIAREDIKYGINREYRREMNCYGLITWYCPDCGMTTPVTCQHGGSMWMCPECYLGIVKGIERKEQNRLLEAAEVGGH
jgi:hypothetical protein